MKNLESIREILEFYSDGDHFIWSGGSDGNEFTFEDGSFAKDALANMPKLKTPEEFLLWYLKSRGLEKKYPTLKEIREFLYEDL